MIPRRRKNSSGFSVMELVMVVLLLAILAAIAIPNLIDLKTDGKNGATYSALGVLRSAIAIAAASLQLKEDEGSESPLPKYPTLAELNANAFSESRSSLAGTAIFEGKEGIPENPWTPPSVEPGENKKIFFCGTTKSTLSSVPGTQRRGWCYDEQSGDIWANTDLNGGEPGKTENFF